MFTYAPRLVQRASPPAHERISSQGSSSVPHSHTPSHPSPTVPIPTRHSQTPSPQSIPVVAPRHNPELWVDALKEDVEAEFNLSLVDSMKAPHLSRQSQPIPIPIQRNSSRNGVPRGSSMGGRSVSIGNGPIASSSSSSPRAFPSRRNSNTQHASARPFQSSPESFLPSEASSVGSTHDKEMDRRYQEHRAAVQKREQEVQRKEAAALRYAEEARRREEWQQQQQQQKLRAGAGVAAIPTPMAVPRGEVKVRF
ncbi:hypothetical protein EDB87DRAFT_761347 [Lactarius vividus]|nr:hypothetical protein EDB87DRAFT_761347 [Lactarius vividus]